MGPGGGRQAARHCPRHEGGQHSRPMGSCCPQAEQRSQQRQLHEAVLRAPRAQIPGSEAGLLWGKEVRGRRDYEQEGRALATRSREVSFVSRKELRGAETLS